MAKRFNYPEAYRNETVVDEYFGNSIQDPYRWLENTNSEETKQFIAEQNDLTSNYLAECPLRQVIREKLNEFSDITRRTCPARRGTRYFYSESNGLQNHKVFYSKQSRTAEPIQAMDPNEFSSDGSVSITIHNFSSSGKFLAFGLCKNGSDWMTICFKNLETNRICEDMLMKVKFNFGIAWYGDSGIFYSCFPHYLGNVDGTDSGEVANQKLYYHRIGTSQEYDILVAGFPQKPHWIIGSSVSDCGNYLIMTMRQGVRDEMVLIAELNAGLIQDLDLKFNKLVTKFDADYNYITNEGPLFYFRTNKEAPNFRLVSINLKFRWWNSVVAEHANDVLERAKCVNGNKLLISYLRDMKNVLQIRSLTKNRGILHEIPIDFGSMLDWSADRWFNDFFIQVEYFVSPGQIFYVDLHDDKPQLKAYHPNPTNAINEESDQEDPTLYTTKQVFYSSKDGTKIPLDIVHMKDLKPGKNTPCILHGYGGYGNSLYANYSPFNILFMKHYKGVYAVAHIRGGGEYGKNWHNGGRLLKKQNCFDDFQAAAKYLIHNKLTSAKRLTIHGQSNGGLLVGACINQRPDLFGVAIAEVGIMDMLRYPKFTVGSFWFNEFGNPHSSSAHFENLLKFSPLHNVKKPMNTQYPAVLLMTAQNDDRVVPAHSLKFIAELQHRLGEQENPLMIRIQTQAGHGWGKPIQKLNDERTDIMLFIVRALGLKFQK